MYQNGQTDYRGVSQNLTRPSDDHNCKYCNYFGQTNDFTLREERRLRMFENRVLRRVFGPKRDEVTGEWRKLHNEELNDLYCSPNIVRVTKSTRMC